MSDSLRHLTAGVASAAAYLALFFGLSVVWWAALAAALIAYLGAFLAAPRRTPADERMLTADVSEADLEAALQAFSAASAQLGRLSKRAPAADRSVLARMSETLTRIAAHHRSDPRDLRHTRRFLRHDLPRIVETASGYVDLAARARPEDAGRLGELARMIAGWAPALARIEQACLENDFMALEVEAEVLSDQLGRR